MALRTLPFIPGVDTSVAMQQIVTAGSQFTGVTPTGTQSLTNKQIRFAGSTLAGLFYFQQVETAIVTDYYFDFGTGNVSSINIYVCDVVATTGLEVAGTSQQVDGANTVRYLKKTTGTLITLGTNQALKVVTTGGTGILIGTAFAMNEKGFYGA